MSSASPASTRPRPDDPSVVAWERVLGRFADLFTQPSRRPLLHPDPLLGALPRPPHRHPDGGRHRSGWPPRPPCLPALPAGGEVGDDPALVPLLASHLDGNHRLILDLDDTLFHEAGRKVYGAARSGCRGGSQLRLGSGLATFREGLAGLLGDCHRLLAGWRLDVVEDGPVIALGRLPVGLADLLQDVVGDVDGTPLAQALREDLLGVLDTAGPPSVMPSNGGRSPPSRRSLRWACQLSKLSAPRRRAR